MNNLNDPDWDRGPEQGAGGNNSKWNYVPFIPLLGFAAIQWVRSKHAQKLEQDLETERKTVAILKAKKDQEQILWQEVEKKLMERQHIYCSLTTPKVYRKPIENDLLDMAVHEPALAQLNMKKDLENIFMNDRSCRLRERRQAHERESDVGLSEDLERKEFSAETQDSRGVSAGYTAH
ncbi:hypothetical protein AALO_G00259580 [Alosa alosa]|uniref:Uncharacterized protein n=2 Tax=Alosa alosa TaxID=278164 RepID=A0AAV6FT41_9TELE|nr:hypothetical protein AALO_G00259580 [Alosa alosa]